ncbi:hypothetical protein J6590_061152 [Homalodisca vitripennis]|nr:hypothetical protein J6590_061152 [Homalodisca vitripennis]
MVRSIGKANEYVLIQRSSSSQLMYRDIQDNKQVYEYDIVLIVASEESPDPTVLRLRYFILLTSRSTTNTTSGAHGGIVQSRTEVDLILTDFDKDKREAIVSLPRKMLVKYTAGNDCQHQKSSTIFNNKKYTEENSV